MRGIPASPGPPPVLETQGYSIPEGMSRSEDEVVFAGIRIVGATPTAQDRRFHTRNEARQCRTSSHCSA